jgi:CRISPR/Cas system-associated endonuclease Cas1
MAQRAASDIASAPNPEGASDTRAWSRRRPSRLPADAVNAVLSLGYSLLTHTWHTVLSGVGFDPYLGFYHRPRFGRPGARSI